MSSPTAPIPTRLERLRQTATFHGESFHRWLGCRVGVVGCGNVGSRLALEIVRTGAEVCVIDMDHVEPSNLGTQVLRPGMSKVASVVRDCDAIWAGRARGLPCDVRHVGVGELERFDLLVDATDDPTLAEPLTRISNGLATPLIRVAMDGSGRRELGRVLVSHGGGGHACQLCTYSPRDLTASLARTPCPGAFGGAGTARGGPRPPTIAGGGLGMAIAGLALLQAQRLVGGTDDRLALGREVLLDLGGPALHSFELRRSPDCLSGHQRWGLRHLPDSTAETTLRDLFERARRDLTGSRGAGELSGGGGSSAPGGIVLEPFLHPLCLEATCRCGARQRAVGSVWAPAPTCEACGSPDRVVWREDVKLPRLVEAQARELGILDTPLEALGLPDRGGMVVARGPGGREARYVLDAAGVPDTPDSPDRPDPPDPVIEPRTPNPEDP